MGNKQQLQLNNETLASILSNVLGLPSQESLKHGAYVWKKYERTVAEQKIEIETEITEKSSSPLVFDEDIGGYLYYATEFTKDATTGLYTLVNPSQLGPATDEGAFQFFSNQYITYNSPSSSRMFKAPNSSSGNGLNIGGNGSGKLIAYAANPTDTSYIPYMYEYVDDVIDTFIDYVVSDSPTAYPDGAVHTDGYWYEKFQLDPALFGCTKCAVDKFTFSERTAASSTWVNHSLGEIPKISFVISESSLSSKVQYDLYFSALWKAPFIGNNSTEEYCEAFPVIWGASNFTANAGQGIYSNYLTDESIRIYGRDSYYVSGVEYTLITMA